MTLQPSEGVHASIRGRIAVELRQAIIAGDLVPGDRVVEAELATKLGTSRAPVREALRQLVNEGFLDSLAYRARRVSTHTTPELSEVLVPICGIAETFALRHLMRNDDATTVRTLWPGDVVSTGTPEGVVLGRPQRDWVKPGDRYDVEVGSLGRLITVFA